MVLIDASTRWSRMYYDPQEIMLSMIICSNYQIKEHIIRNTQSNPSGLKNAAKFSSKTFNYYFMALGINVEYFCTHTKWISQISYQENHLLDRILS